MERRSSDVAVSFAACSRHPFSSHWGNDFSGYNFFSRAEIYKSLRNLHFAYFLQTSFLSNLDLESLQVNATIKNMNIKNMTIKNIMESGIIVKSGGKEEAKIMNGHLGDDEYADPKVFLSTATALSKWLQDGVNFWSEHWNTSANSGWKIAWAVRSPFYNTLPPIYLQFHRHMSFCKVSFDLTLLGPLDNASSIPEVTEQHYGHREICCAIMPALEIAVRLHFLFY